MHNVVCTFSKAPPAKQFSCSVSSFLRILMLMLRHCWDTSLFALIKMLFHLFAFFKKQWAEIEETFWIIFIVFYLWEITFSCLKKFLTSNESQLFKCAMSWVSMETFFSVHSKFFISNDWIPSHSIFRPIWNENGAELLSDFYGNEMNVDEVRSCRERVGERKREKQKGASIIFHSCFVIQFLILTPHVSRWMKYRIYVAVDNFIILRFNLAREDNY
jgi:hypothetical protein